MVNTVRGEQLIAPAALMPGAAGPRWTCLKPNGDINTFDAGGLSGNRLGTDVQR
ncbi:hypothetical protein ACWD5Q_24365 [Streptomyces sp. NPDC002513]